MRLPLRVAGYRLSPDGARFYYEDLVNGSSGTIGLITGQRAAITDEALEAGMRKFIQEALQLRPGALEKHAFQPRSSSPAKGRKWVFRIDGEAPGVNQSSAARHLQPAWCSGSWIESPDERYCARRYIEIRWETVRAARLPRLFYGERQ